ncbi:MAG: hypothetical protein U0169_07635 [Polyangiaceae bacterium]
MTELPDASRAKVDPATGSVKARTDVDDAAVVPVLVVASAVSRRL